MFATILAGLMTVAQQNHSRGDVAFEAARWREYNRSRPELVLLVEHPAGVRWETVTVYLDVEEAAYWVVRRDRWSDSEDQEHAPVAAQVSWADSRTCAAVMPMLEAVERIPPVPYDMRWIGSDDDGDVIVGFARIRFWLNSGPRTPSIETYADRNAAKWYSEADLEDCWSDLAPDDAEVEASGG